MPAVRSRANLAFDAQSFADRMHDEAQLGRDAVKIRFGGENLCRNGTGLDPSFFSCQAEEAEVRR
jgi:hypothetical protein